ncbi:HAD superfamily hydrolase [Natronomonas moolapensis 8.8.11]|uniref:HAD superfamily hydrolase n=1 Tax=Natronomonas moolapensis (strain DSM 18674 / CECT 7526 / JCM 14361 / 8.8.11) TaxID=268739 RepID=M1XNS5_NATM8|nr:HAD hydrolase family protein [Natronomonas moolapensis]CCQ35598.1 HAD superfamily hydrolase [Natronomonas moolapensis 8.8.11]
MERYDLLYRLYEEFDTETLRAYQEFVDLFPPVDSRVTLNQWQEINAELDDRKDDVRDSFPLVGDTYAELAASATREQAFGALDLYSKYDRGVNVLVLDVDETLRSAGNTDNEIPRETLHLLTRFHEDGVPIVICTGQTLENVKGFLIQGLGSRMVHSGTVSVVYEAGTGVFTPGHGPDTKRLRYETLGADVRDIFNGVRTRVLSDAPPDLRRGCHLQGNEFNVTLKPNFETASEDAERVIERALVYLLDLLEDSVAAVVDADRNGENETDTEAKANADPGTDVGAATAGFARAYYAADDPEIAAVLAATDEEPDTTRADVPEAFAAAFDRIDVAYYEADAAEIGSLELDKAAGVEAAFEVLGIEDPFALVMGDSKSDLRVMEWVDEHDAGIAAAPEHSSPDVITHVAGTDDLRFARGDAPDVLRTAYALNRLAALDE